MVRALFIALVALALAAAPAFANTCPALIAQLTDAVAKVDANDPKAAQVKGLIAEAQKRRRGEARRGGRQGPGGGEAALAPPGSGLSGMRRGEAETSPCAFW